MAQEVLAQGVFTTTSEWTNRAFCLPLLSPESPVPASLDSMGVPGPAPKIRVARLGPAEGWI